MFKKRLTLLASLIILPVLTLGGIKSFVPAYAEDEEPEVVEKEYAYTESGSKEEGNIYRTYLTSELSPKLVKSFKAPYGFNVKLSIEDEVLDDLMNEMVELGLDNGPAIMPAYYYHYFGSRIFVDVGYFTGDDTEGNKQQFKEDLESLILFSVEELTTSVELQFEMNIEFATNWDGERGDATFTIYSDVYTFEPYKETDFVNIDTFYYQAEEGNDIRVDIRGKPMEGLLASDPYDFTEPNPDGFVLDDDEYEITIMASGIPLGNNSVEMSFPITPFDVNARIRFKSNGVQYVFYSETITLADPHADILVDGYPDRDEIVKDSEHEFSFHVDYFDLSEMDGGYLSINLNPYHLEANEDIPVLWDEEAAKPGEEGKVYYIPSEEEKASHTLNDNLDEPAPGRYVTWGYDYWSGSNNWVYYSYDILNIGSYSLEEEESEPFDGDLAKAFSVIKSVPYIGTWGFWYEAHFGDAINRFYLETVRDKFIKVVATEPKTDKIVLDVDDNVNLVAGAGSFTIVPTIETERTNEVQYYFSYGVDKEGVIEVEQDENGVLTINPINHGLVQLTIYEECRYYSAISKTITLRVLDTVFDVSKLEIPDEFHYVGKDLTATISVRGFTNIRNLDIEWIVLGKDGNAIPEDKYTINNDASMTIQKAERNDYTITACYEGIELGSQVVEVRKININQFLHANIWWIVLITIFLVALFFFFRKLLKRGKTTVQNIQKAYDVYCACLSDDKLTLTELKRIKREISRCLHRCEDLNIEALNQYEKSIRYLRKSLNDTKPLVKNWETISLEDKNVFIDKLDKDLSKALNVAREIENAKDLIEQYHNKANRSNYEVLQEEKPDKKSRKKDN